MIQPIQTDTITQHDHKILITYKNIFKNERVVYHLVTNNYHILILKSVCR